MLRLGCREDGENIVNCWYSEATYLEAKLADGTVMRYDYMIPATWLKEVPSVGVLKFRYVSEKPSYIDTPFRRRLGEEALNWRTINLSELHEEDCTRPSYVNH